MSEVRDIKRFPKISALRAYMGIDSTVYESGNFRGKSKISKRGNRYARRIIWIMSVMISKYNPYFARYFIKKENINPLRLPTEQLPINWSELYALVTQGTHFNHHV